MMRVYILTLTILASGLTMAQRPFINGLDKTTGTPNEIVTISGSNFDVDDLSGSPEIFVYFGIGRATTIETSTADLIQVRVPATATYGPVTVVNSDGLMATSSQLFTVAFDDDSELASWTDLPAPAAAQSTGNDLTYDLCICDFTGDGLMDAVLTNDGDLSTELTLVTNTTSTPGSASFSLIDQEIDATTAEQTHNAACADLDGDGDSDLVVSSQQSGQNFIHVYENATPGTFTFTLAQAKLFVPTLSDGSQRVLKRVRLGDIDGDGAKDVVVGSASEDDNVFFVFLNNSSGSVSYSSSPTTVTVDGARDAGSIFLADMDNDGRVDVVSNSVNDADLIYINRNTSSDGNVQFETAGTAGASGTRQNIVIADFNNDGLNDIAATSTQALELFENDGDLNFTTITAITEAGIQNWGLDAGDLNGDGWVDVVTGSLTGEVIYYENETTTTGASISFGSEVLEDDGGSMGPVRNIRIGDLDDDGLPDLAFTHNSITGQGDFRYLLNDLVMTPVITPTTGVYCTDQNFILRATEGHNLTYTWDVSSVDPGVTGSELDLNYTSNTGAKSIFVVAQMADGSTSNTSATRSILHDATSVTAPTVDGGITSVTLCVQEELSFSVTSSTSGSANFYWYGPNGLLTECTTGTCVVADEAEAENSGDYYLIVDSGDGTCQSPESNHITVSVQGPPIINAEFDQCNDGNITLIAPDYTDQFDYQWKLNGSSDVGSPNETSITVSSSGDYTLEISDGTCTRVSNTIGIPDGPTSSFDGPSFGATDEVCVDVETTFTATSTDNSGQGLTLEYNWTIEDPLGAVTNPTGNSVNMTFTSTGTATVILETVYSDGIGCSVEEKSITISDVPSHTANFSQSDAEAGSTEFEKCPGDVLTLNFLEFGTEITSVSWDSLGIATVEGNNLTVTEAGTYVATYQTNTGCSNTYEIVVENYPDLELTVSDPDGVYTPTLSGGQVELEDGQLSVTISTAATVTEHDWSIIDGNAQVVESGTSYQVTPSTPTVTIEVTGTTAAGCVETETVLVIGGTFLARKSFSPNGDGINDCWTVINSSILDDCKVYILDSRGRHILEQDLPSGNTTDPDCIWEGISGSSEVPEGIYYFVMKCSDSGRNQTGSILLSR